MKRFATVWSWLVACYLSIFWVGAWGQPSTAPPLEPGAFGTRSSTPLTRVAPASDSQFGWVQLGVALLIVAVGLRWGLPKLLRWATRTGEGSPVDGQIRIIEMRSAPNGTLMLVKARDKLLLIGATAQGMHLLADLTDTLPPPTRSSESPFEQVLRNARPVSPPRDDWQQEVAAHVRTRLRETQEQLQRLLGDTR
ncbi:MAG: flagellar biosynthetic protein FliO [Fimbriimonadales bacterium]|nr:flagellar biosynthetic protein FliO [Fimbriimonadales bacterium]MDW8052161.1 flagellar biosynthetic protein FliO [Armatimonadota bacterium]